MVVHYRAAGTMNFSDFSLSLWGLTWVWSILLIMYFQRPRVILSVFVYANREKLSHFSIAFFPYITSPKIVFFQTHMHTHKVCQSVSQIIVVCVVVYALESTGSGCGHTSWLVTSDKLHYLSDPHLQSGSVRQDLGFCDDVCEWSGAEPRSRVPSAWPLWQWSGTGAGWSQPKLWRRLGSWLTYSRLFFSWAVSPPSWDDSIFQGDCLKVQEFIDLYDQNIHPLWKS